MKKFLTYTLLGLLLLILGAVLYIDAQKKKRIKLQPILNETIYTPSTTEFVIPLSIALEDIEKLANTRLKTVLFDGPIPTRKGKDTIFLTIKRTKDIQFSFANNKLNALVSLAAHVKYKLHIAGKKSKMFFDAEPLDFAFDALLETPVVLMPDYGFKPATNIKSIRWKKEPVIKVGAVQINLKEDLEEMVSKNEKFITLKLNEIIDEKITLRKTLAVVWENIQRPIRLSKTGMIFYLRKEPSSLAVWTAPHRGDSINLIVKLEGLVHIVHEKDTILFKKTELPKKLTILKTEPADDTSHFYVHMMIPLAAMEKLGDEKLAAKPIAYEDYSINVKKINIVNGAASTLINIKYDGDASGEFKLKGEPYLDMKTRNFYVNNLEFESNDDDVLVDAADKVLHDVVLEQLQESFTINVGSMIDTLPLLIRRGIDKSKIASKMNIDFSGFEISDVKTYLTAKNIQLMVDGRTYLSLHLKRDAIIKKK